MLGKSSKCPDSSLGKWSMRLLHKTPNMLSKACLQVSGHDNCDNSQRRHISDYHRKSEKHVFFFHLVVLTITCCVQILLPALRKLWPGERWSNTHALYTQRQDKALRNAVCDAMMWETIWLAAYVKRRGPLRVRLSPSHLNRSWYTHLCTRSDANTHTLRGLLLPYSLSAVSGRAPVKHVLGLFEASVRAAPNYV